MPWLLREPGPTVFVCASLGRSWPLLRPQMDSRNAETSYNRIAFILAQIARPSRATARARVHRSRPAGRLAKSVGTISSVADPASNAETAAQLQKLCAPSRHLQLLRTSTQYLPKMEAYAEFLDLAKLAWKDLSSHQLFLPATLGLAIVSLTVILFNLLKPVHASAPRKSPKKKPATPVGTTKVEPVRRSTRCAGRAGLPANILRYAPRESRYERLVKKLHPSPWPMQGAQAPCKRRLLLAARLAGGYPH